MNPIIATYNRVSKISKREITRLAARHGRSPRAELYSICRESLSNAEAHRVADILMKDFGFAA